MSKLNKIVFPLSFLFLISASHTWADQAASDETSLPASASFSNNVEALEEDEESTWSWFGMGFEARSSVANSDTNEGSSSRLMNKGHNGRKK